MAHIKTEVLSVVIIHCGPYFIGLFPIIDELFIQEVDKHVLHLLHLGNESQEVA
jgi:hypothetical protein